VLYVDPAKVDFSGQHPLRPYSSPMSMATISTPMPWPGSPAAPRSSPRNRWPTRFRPASRAR
jgi:hypothetical protein